LIFRTQYRNARTKLERHFSLVVQKLDVAGYFMAEEKTTKHTGVCYDCKGTLELYEMDIKKSTKIMLCQNCGMFHFYKKDLLGSYRLTKVSKNPEAEH